MSLSDAFGSALLVASLLTSVGSAIPLQAGVGERPEDAPPRPTQRTTTAGKPPGAASSETTVEESVTVQRDAQPIELEDIAAFRTVLDGADLRERADDLAGLLRRVPGARVREYGGVGAFATLSLRASTADQVPVYVDGILQNRSFGGPFNLASVPISQIDSVTVFRGNAPAGLGLGGIGGAVDIRTRRLDRPAVDATQLLGELDTSRTTVAATLPAWGGHIGLSAERLASDGDYPFLDTNGTPSNLDDDVIRRQQNNDVERFGGQLSGSWEGIGGGRLSTSLRLRGSDRGLAPTFFVETPSARLEDDEQELRVRWDGRAEGALRELRLEAAAFGQSTRFVSRGFDFARVADTTTDLAGVQLAGGVVVGTGAATDRWFWRFSRETASVTNDALDVSDRGGARRWQGRLTWERVQPIGRFILAPALSVDALRDDADAGDLGADAPQELRNDVTSNEVVGKLAVAYTLSERATLRATAARNVRRPKLSERFGDLGTISGNPDLRSERAWSAEIGASLDGGSIPAGANAPDRGVGWSASAVAFARRVDDLIRLELVGLSTVKPFNLDRADVAGVELAGTVDLPFGWLIDASGTLQRTEDRRLEERIPFQPDLLAALGIRWQAPRDRLRVRWEVTYTGSNLSNPVDLDRTRLPERWVHDAGLVAAVGGGVELGIDIDNVFDRRQLDLFDFPLPDRVISFFVGWRGSRR